MFFDGHWRSLGVLRHWIWIMLPTKIDTAPNETDPGGLKDHFFCLSPSCPLPSKLSFIPRGTD